MSSMLLERTGIALFVAICLCSPSSIASAQNKNDARSLQELLERQEEKLKILQTDFVALRSKLEELLASHSPVRDRKDEEGFRALYTMNRDGSDVEFLVAAPGMISSSTADWSHDGKIVAFDCVPTLHQFDKSHVFVYAVEGPFKGTTRDLGFGNVPCWSPDDRTIAFMLNGSNPAGARGGIWTMDADGSNRKWLCRGWYPRWSPDGKEICCHAYFDRPQSLHVVHVKTGKIRKLFGETYGVKFGGATWSPDGKKFVFIAVFNGKEHLATADVDGNPDSLKILYQEDNESRALVGPPSWSPDGKQIVFAIQDRNAAGSKGRRWHHTYLYSISAEVPSAPVQLETERVGLINRGMMWSPDSSKIVFSSER
jgi:dipeptidyl aminopeptidase/acylaminoacyl peptidase